MSPAGWVGAGSVGEAGMGPGEVPSGAAPSRRGTGQPVTSASAVAEASRGS